MDSLYSEALSNFEKIFAKAQKLKLNDPKRMVLATVGPDGTPSTRVVLLKSHDGTRFVFLHQQEKLKGRQLAENPRFSLFLWDELANRCESLGRSGSVSEEEAQCLFGLPGREGASWALGVPSIGNPGRQNHAFETRGLDGKRVFFKIRPRPPHWAGSGWCRGKLNSGHRGMTGCMNGPLPVENVNGEWVRL